MKIIWLHAHFLNWMGGHNYIYEVAKRIRQRHNLVVLSSASTDDARNKMASINVPLHDLSGKSTDSLIYWLFLKSYIKKEEKRIYPFLKDCDIVISSHFPFNIIGNHSKKPHLYCCWEPYALFYDEHYIKGFRLRERLLIRLMALLYKNLDIDATREAARVLTISQYNKDWIKRIYGRGDAVVTYEGVDTEFFRPIENNELKRKYNGFKLIMHSTDFTAIKGTEHLIHAIPLILKKVPKIKVLITHSLKNQDKKKAIVKLAEELGVLEAIELLGRVDYNLLPAYYSISDVVVQPSVNQSMSLSVKEGMSCGTPIVTSTEGREQTEDGEAGFLVDPHNKEALSKAIVTILKDKKLSEGMGRRGREIVMKRFSWDAVANIFLKVIGEVS